MCSCAGIALMMASAIGVRAEEPQARTALRAKYDQLRNGPKSSFGIPLYIDSRQTDDALSGSVYSQVEQPFEAVKKDLREPRHWCEILILHPNVKGCSVSEGTAKPSLSVVLGSMEQTATFTFEVVAATAEFLDVRLNAASGPMGTTDYRFTVQATPLDARRTLLHLAYSHGYGARAKIAMQTYFGTLGRGKVGFTVVDTTTAGSPVHVDGLRGGLERNAMRYYLAIQAHLDQMAAPREERLEKCLRTWLVHIERYPLQLKEVDGYVERKRAEIRRFETQPGSLSQQAGKGRG